MKRSVSLKMVLTGKKNKNNENQIVKQHNKILISVTVLGSPGPLRFTVNEDDTVSTVIDSCLKLYARGGRLPVIGSDFTNFLLYSSDAESGYTLDSSEAIGSCCGRKFMLYKKQNNAQVTGASTQMMAHRQNSNRWKSFLCLVQ